MAMMTDLYPSRTNDKPTIIERKDPIVYTNDEGSPTGPLDKVQLEFYEENGYLFFVCFFPKVEVQAMRDELDRIWEASRFSDVPEVIREPGSEEIRSVFAIHRDNAFFRRFSRDPRIVQIMEQILGSEVYIHQSRINFKPGFTGKGFYWHSDFETWHVEDGMTRMRAVSLSIALTDNYSYNGPLMVIPGSHKYYISCAGETPENHYEQSLRNQELGVPDHESLRWLVNKYGIEVPTGPAGSMLLFDCNIMHGSAGNMTPLPRSNVFMVYNSVENKVVEPFSGQAPRPEFLSTRSA